jgi:hypothetical protein
MNDLLARYNRGEELTTEELEQLYPDIDDDDYEIYEPNPKLTGWKAKTICNIVNLGDKVNCYTIVRVGHWLARKLL